MNRKRALYNIVFGFGGQFIILVLGIVLPRIMLVNYGSDVNGLTNTVVQIYTYMALLEAGIGQATKNALYEPLAAKDKAGISCIMSVSRRYFRKITIYYAIGIVLLSGILPYVLKSRVDKTTIFLVVLLEGITGVVSFYFLQNWLQLLVADGRGYIKANIELIAKIVGYGVKIVLASFGVNIAILQLMYFVISLGKLVYLKRYFRKHFAWIDYNVAPKEVVLKDKSAFILSEIAWTIFSSTDMIVLSVFVGTQLSSVYSVYNLVFQNLSLLLNAVYSGTVFLLGQAFFRNRNKYVVIHDAFNSIYMCLITILMSVAYLLILPFIRLYTVGVSDVDYIYTQLPLLFCLVQLFSWGRYIGGNLTSVAGYAKVTAKVSLVEALINLVLSVVLVNRFGIVGVLVATVCALPVKLIAVTYLSDVKILHRNVIKSIAIMGVNMMVFTTVVIVDKYLTLDINSYIDLFLYGGIFTVIVTVIAGAANVAVNPSAISYLFVFAKRKGEKRS